MNPDPIHGDAEDVNLGGGVSVYGSRFHRYRAGSVTAVALAGLMVGSVAEDVHADGWFVEPSAKISADHNDNIRLSTQSPESVTGAVVNAGVAVSRESETTKFVAKPSVQFQRYSSESDLDRDYQFLDLSATHKMERSELGLAVDYRHDSTLVSEVEGSGIVLKGVGRRYHNVAPSFAYQLTERSTVGVSVGMARADYEQTGLNGLVDYDYDTMSARYTYRLTELDDVSATVYRSAYEARDRDTQVDSTGVQLGWQHRFAEDITGTAMLGNYNTDYKFLVFGIIPFEESKSGMIADLGLKARLERGELAANVARNLVPSALGDVQQQDSLRLSLAHSFSERLQGTFGATAIRTEQLSSNLASSDRDYRNFSASIAWRWLPEWWISGGYNYTWQKYDSQTRDASSSAVNVGVEYRGLKKDYQTAGK